MAKLEPLVEHLPELLFVPAADTCGASDIDKVKGHDALIESAVIFGLAVLIDIRRQEASAAHAGVAVSVTVLIYLEFEHHFFRDIVRHHAFCRAARRKLGKVPVWRIFGYIIVLKHIYQLRERRCHINARLVLDSQQPLVEHFLDYHGKIALFLLVSCLAEVHEHGYERSLSVGRKQCHDLILQRLYSAVYLLAKSFLDDLVHPLLVNLASGKFKFFLNLTAYFLTRNVHKRRKMRKADALTAVLVRGYLRDYLC